MITKRVPKHKTMSLEHELTEHIHALDDASVVTRHNATRLTSMIYVALLRTRVTQISEADGMELATLAHICALPMCSQFSLDFYDSLSPELKPTFRSLLSIAFTLKGCSYMDDQPAVDADWIEWMDSM